MMPRLSPSLIRQANALSPNGFLSLLLRECRDLQSARNELRWLKEAAVAAAAAATGSGAKIDEAQAETEHAFGAETRTGAGAGAGAGAGTESQSQAIKMRTERIAKKVSPSPSSSLLPLSSLPLRPQKRYRNAHRDCRRHGRHRWEGKDGAGAGAGAQDGEAESVKLKPQTTLSKSAQTYRHLVLRGFVNRRSKGEPLQYILGNQPFGDLDIRCHPGVLIPRSDTEAYTIMLARLINQAIDASQFDCIGQHGDGHDDTTASTFTKRKRKVRLQVADLCTGTGCIALLLHSLLHPRSPNSQHLHRHNNVNHNRQIRIVGADVSPRALELATENLNRNIDAQCLHHAARSEVEFCRLDVLELGYVAACWSQLALDRPANSSDKLVSSSTLKFLSQSWPVIVSNPPYISSSDYAPGGTTTHSVRRYEPKLALVPPALSPEVRDALFANAQVEQADCFYAALLHVAVRVKTELLVMEIGDLEQSERVVRLARHIMKDAYAHRAADSIIEIWRDDDSVEVWHQQDSVSLQSEAKDGKANRRAMVIWGGGLAKWRSRAKYST